MLVGAAPVIDRVRLAILAALVAVSLVWSAVPVSAAHINFGPLELIDPNNITWERSTQPEKPDKDDRPGNGRANSITWE